MSKKCTGNQFCECRECEAVKHMPPVEQCWNCNTYLRFANIGICTTQDEEMREKDSCPQWTKCNERSPRQKARDIVKPQD